MASLCWSREFVGEVQLGHRQCQSAEVVPEIHVTRRFEATLT